MIDVLYQARATLKYCLHNHARKLLLLLPLVETALVLTNAFREDKAHVQIFPTLKKCIENIGFVRT